MRKIKIIYINTRYKGRTFYDQDHDFFYLFGVGNIFSYQILKMNPDIEVENWRADWTVNQDLVRVIDGITCRVFKGKETKFTGTYSSSMVKMLRQFSRSKQYAIILHFHGMHNIGFDLISWMIPKVPIVATHHGGGNFLYKYSLEKSIKKYFAERIDRFSIKKRFDHLFLQTSTEKLYIEGIKGLANISRFTPFGFDFDVFKLYDKTNARIKLGIPLDKKIILSVGRADFLKGVQKVVQVFNDLKTQMPELELLCVDVQPGDMYYNMVKESGAIIVGHVSWHDLPMYYSAADVLVYLPFDDESLNFAGPGCITAEALACGLPVVSPLLVHYWDDSIHEVARIPENLGQVPVMILDILVNPPKPEKCREISYKYFNWEYVMEKHLMVYNDLLKKYYPGETKGILRKNQL